MLMPMLIILILVIPLYLLRVLVKAKKNNKLKLTSKK